MGAVIPLSRSAPAKVVVFQWPSGIGERNRGRAILVEAPVSAMKTRRSGSRSGCASNQACRRTATSGRACSLACAVVLKGHRVPVEEAPNRAGREGRTVLVTQQLRQFHTRDVRPALDRGQDDVAPGRDAMRAQIAAAGLGAGRNGGVPVASPAHGAGHRDAEASGGTAPRHAALDWSDQTGAKVFGQRSGRARWPPCRAGRVNQIFPVSECLKRSRRRILP